MEFHIAHLSNINTTNSSDQSYLLTYPPYAEHSPGKFAVYMFFAVTFCILGVFGNISCYHFDCTRKATADILVAGLVLPFSMAGVLLGEEFFYHRPKTCEFLASVCWISCASAFFNVTGLSINRMILIWFPKLYVRIFTWKTTPIIAFIPWIVTILSMIPLLTDWTYLEYDPESMICLVDVDYVPSNMYISVFLLIPIFATFTAVVMGVRVKVIKGKKQDFAVIAPNVLLMSTFLPAPEEEHLHNTVDEKSEELQHYLNHVMITVKMLSCLFAAFFIWTPFVIGLLSHHIVNYGRDFWAFANLLGHMQPGLDCICYIVANKYFRIGYKNIILLVLRCKARKATQ